MTDVIKKRSKGYQAHHQRPLKKSFSIIQIIKINYYRCKNLSNLTSLETIRKIYKDLKSRLFLLIYCTMNKKWTSTQTKNYTETCAENIQNFIHLIVT